MSNITLSTPISGAFLMDGRVKLGTVKYTDESRTEAALINLATGDDHGLSRKARAESQRRVIGRMKHAGNANFRGGSFSLAALGTADVWGTGFRYADIFTFIDESEVGSTMTKKEKADLKAALKRHYGWDQ